MDPVTLVVCASVGGFVLFVLAIVATRRRDSADADRPADTIAALYEVGADTAAEVLAAACARFDGALPATTDERIARIHAAWDRGEAPFAEADERLWKVHGDTSARLVEFTIAHAADFRDAGG